MFGESLCDMSVLGSKVFGQALMEWIAVITNGHGEGLQQKKVLPCISPS